MPTISLPIANPATDDQVVQRRGVVTYANIDTAAFTRFTTSTSVAPQRTFLTATSEYQIGNALLRWDTSQVPASATVTSAVFRFYQQGRVQADGLNVSGGAYQWDGVSTTDWTHAPDTDLFSAPFSGFTTNQNWWEVSLSSPNTYISRTGYSYMRLCVTELAADAAPTGQNLLDIRSSHYDVTNGTNYAPRLVITYVPRDGIAIQSPPDAILSQTNLTGAVTAIDEDPDAADTSWLTAP